MKTRTLLLSIFAIIASSFLFAQSIIPIQGIARNGNTAFIEQEVIVSFEIYFNNGGTPISITQVNDIALMTDAYGVFSYELIVSNDKSYAIANHEAFLRIKVGNTTISDERLGDVPYALVARNGVPTGAIMAYTGSTPPTGWLLCDGSDIPAGADFNDLRNLLVANLPAGTGLQTGKVPDLRGMFLRGAGVNQIIPTLNAPLNTMYGDTFSSHRHAARENNGVGLTTNFTGNHAHSINVNQRGGAASVGSNVAGPRQLGGVDQTPGGWSELSSDGAGGHSHIVDGNTAHTGSGETRPDHYAVTYMIKL